jgi:uncharacterized membrane protein YoaK (UPF0700 family)
MCRRVESRTVHLGDAMDTGMEGGDPVSARVLSTTWVKDPKHGPLPILLLMLTVATGVVDAVSILGLGRVFVANMTGNVVFIGFALTGAPGFALAASLAALGGFLVGALVGGRLVDRFSGHRGLLLRNTMAAALLLVVIGLLVFLVVPAAIAAVAALLAAAMGIQNAAARRLAVPDLTTTVLTMTLTGLAADVHHTGWSPALRRLLAVLTMLGGAVIGALLVLHSWIAWALGLVAGVMAVVALAAALASGRPAAWQRP